MGRALGIDYGEKRVGIALSDEAKRVAFPKAVLTNTDALVDAVATIAETEQVDLFVLGESDNPAGGENAITHRIAIFGEALKVRSAIPVVYVSEAYSSAEVRRAFEKQESSRNRQPAIDAAAAAIILQTYLDSTVSHMPPVPTPHMVSLETFKSIEMRLGRILSVERVPETDKLLKLSVDFSEATPRQVVSGIAGYFSDPQLLVGKTVPFVTNLEPRTIRGLESQAMIVACSTEEGNFSILEPTMATLPPGTRLN